MNVRTILVAVCSYHCIVGDQLLIGRRTRLYSTARCQTIALARELTSASYLDIAEALQLDVSSATSAMRRHKQLYASDANYIRDFDAIRNSIINGAKP